MNMNRSAENSWTLTDEEKESYRRDAFDFDRARNLSIGRRIALGMCDRTAEAYRRFLEDLKRIFGEISRDK